MSKLKVAAPSVVLLALALVIIWQQQQRVKNLMAEAAGLREQAAQAWSLREGSERSAKALSEENERLAKRHPTAEDLLPEDKFRELLRLRGEVAVLKRQLEAANKLARVQSLASSEGTWDWPERKLRWQEAIASFGAQ